METKTENKRHPFSYTLGMGPYKWVASFNLGAAIAALQSGNVSGHNNMMASAPKVEAGMGTCAHCGTAITLIQIVETGEGKRYGVGSDCILKVHAEGDVDKISDMERQIRIHKRNQGRMSRERKRSALEAKVFALIDENIEKLATLPHPSPSMTGHTMKDWALWIRRRALSIDGLKRTETKLKKVL